MKKCRLNHPVIMRCGYVGGSALRLLTSCVQVGHRKLLFASNLVHSLSMIALLAVKPSTYPQCLFKRFFSKKAYRAAVSFIYPLLMDIFSLNKKRSVSGFSNCLFPASFGALFIRADVIPRRCGLGWSIPSGPFFI